jgi:DNA-binding MarR family transcriptional regulator
MNDHSEHTAIVAGIEDCIRQITWQSHKQLLQTLSRPEIGLTLPQMVTLFAIRDAGSCRMSELAEITQQSAGTLTGIVDRLIDEDLVGRVRDIDDRRVVQVTLTPNGEERIALVEQARREDTEQMLVSFNDDQLHQFLDLLQQLLGDLNQLLNNGDAAARSAVAPTVPPPTLDM